SHVLLAGADRLPDAGVGAAATDVADAVQIGLADRPPLAADLAHERDRRHDLARLAVAALRDVVLDPRLLHRVQVGVHGVGQALDRGDLVVFGDLLHRDRAGVDRLAVQVRRAGLADIDAAPVLRS